MHRPVLMFCLLLCSFWSLHAQPTNYNPPSAEEKARRKSEIKSQLAGTLSDTARVRLSIQLANLEAETDYQAGVAIANDAILLAKKTGDNEYIARSYFSLANIHSRAKHSDEEMEALRLGLPYAEKLVRKELAGNYYDRLGMLYDQRGVWEKSLDYHLKCHAIYVQNKVDERRLAAKKLNIGNVLDRTGRYREAIGWFEQAAAIYEKLSMWDHLAGCYNNIGSAWKNLGEAEKSAQAYAKAGEYAELAKKKASSPAPPVRRN